MSTEGSEISAVGFETSTSRDGAVMLTSGDGIMASTDTLGDLASTEGKETSPVRDELGIEASVETSKVGFTCHDM